MNRARPWCFTLNNYTAEEFNQLNECTIFRYAIIGKERGLNNVPHLQGYIQCFKPNRLSNLKKINPRIHWEIARGSLQDNQKYCKKEKDFVEWGKASTRGQRTDLAGCVEDMLKNKSQRELLRKYGNSYIQYKRNITETAEEIRSKEQKLEKAAEMSTLCLRLWQEEVLKMLENQSRREILFIVDMKGGAGKSTLTDYILCTKNAVAFENGKSSDIKYAYNGEDYVIFDLVRSSQEHINYEIIECIKNRRYLSTKYKSQMKMWPGTTKLVVFMNILPEMNKLSPDRYNIFIIEDDKLTKK